ncbi:inositol monophosphatase [Fertoebacter nigrum]|uniref:Inositol monophosphatase n=1 Tax=Fertoeibacter niger TaxID=2656921 RepID=A0A8X8GWC1_9RHOB|nr:inositol monophosphatase family protein [Fertoeibacter niger]NUB44322.1 inositol monophosphatase [Fertoeibacter niger]
MTDAIAARHQAAEQIAAEAAALALGYFHRRADLVVETKASPQDIVSRADREVETLIRARLAALCPDDGFLGEELGVQAGTSGFTWVIDPIDGTSPFIAGLPHWCVAIALQQGAATVAAVTHVPVADEVFTARQGGGVRLNGALLRLDDAVRLTNSQTGIGASHRSDPTAMAALVQALLVAGGVFYRNGSGALMLASVAAGRLGSYFEAHMHAWDCLGGLLMVREAGGVTAPFCADGYLLAGGRVVAAAPQVWPALQDVLIAAEV